MSGNGMEKFEQIKAAVEDELKLTRSTSIEYSQLMVILMRVFENGGNK